MTKSMPESIKRIAKKLLFPTPVHLSNNQKHIDRHGMDAIKESIKKNYHTSWRKESNYSKEMYKNDLNSHLFKRLESDRSMVIPWIDKVTTLQDKRILEIGCGTGSSTIALAEQGAKVTGIDIDEGALSVANDRSKVYGIEAEYRALNADQIMGTFGTDSFDIIIFFACLEHMTIPERLTSLRHVWEMLSNKGLLIIVETPNRLWYFDDHTSRLPFFNWLPDELAFRYSKFAPRDNFRELYREYNADSKEHFLRRGRGMSFHELEMAICPAQDFKVLSSLSTYEGVRYKLKKSKFERRYKSLLMKIYPNIHEGFFDDFLYLILEK